MSEYRFILEPYKSMKDKYFCPNCNKRTFTRYIDSTNKQQISNKVGKCSRIIKCSYHYPPKEYFNDNSYSNIKYVSYKIKSKIIIKPTTYIDFKILQSSFGKPNNFLLFLQDNLFGKEITDELVKKYNIGTIQYWQNKATIFWQVDTLGKVRTGKVMLYNPKTGKRIKKPYNHINWIHTIKKNENFNLKQCYFGEHLLNNNKDKSVAIVESEKSAIIASIYLPEFIWLACGSVNNLNHEKTKILKGRNVVLFPDLKCYELWKNKIPDLTKLANFKISNLLEKNATVKEKEKGYDIADYLINLNIDYKQFT
jgi:hypothetical protein